MSLFGKLKNIFAGNTNNVNDSKKKPKHSFIKFDSDPNELWEIVGELGDGAFGKVYKAKHKVQQIFAALKQVDINDDTELEDYSVEIDILNQCRHKNIVGLHEAYFFGGKLWMFIEFCGGGALDGIMLELEKPLTEPQIRYVCREMCEALEFLHEHFVIHRDLKAGNVLLTCEGEVKLADFGVSAKNSSYRQKRDTFIGTPYWMAPEVILCETIKDSPYDFKADIWSFGITLIELAQIEPPNHEMHPMRVLIKIQKSESPTLKYPSRWSKEFNDFITKCLAKDPEQRPTAGDLLQHPFIRDVKDGQAIMELVSEANAEIILEEKDLDDDLLDEGIDLENRSAATTDIDSDTASTTSSSNINKPNEDDSISDTSPVSGDTGKVLLPIIAIDATGDKKTNESEKPRSTDEPSPNAEEPVVLRKKKTPPEGDIATSPEDESTSPPTGQKKYRTLTKTRKFVVNGEVVMSKVSKVIVSGSATDKKQQEHQLWKNDLRELKMLHKQEKKQLHDMEIRFLGAIEEQNRKFEQDNAIFIRNAENSLEQMSKQHKQQTDKMAVSHANDMKNMQKKTKQEQDKDLRAFNEGLKQELKLLKQEVDLMPKDVRKDLFQQKKKEKEIGHAEKERKFIEQQKETMDRTLKRVEEQQKDQKALCERQFLQLKQQTIGARETSLWEAEITQLKDRYRLNMQQLDTKFMLKKQLMLVRHAKEMEQVQRINTSKEDELLQCHLLENKRLPKIMKNEGKTRALMFKQSLRISVMGLTAEQEKERIKQFEEVEKNRLKDEETRLRKKHKRHMEELKSKNSLVVKELEQVHAEKRVMLEENEKQKRKELEQEFEEKMKNLIEEQKPKKEALEASFAKEMSDHEKFYANGTSVDQDSCKGVITGVSQMVVNRSSQIPPAAVHGKVEISPQSTKKLEMSVPANQDIKRLSKFSPQVTKKTETTAPVSEDSKRLSKISPQSAKKIEASAPVSHEAKQLSKTSPQSAKKIETSAPVSQDTRHLPKTSPQSTKKIETLAPASQDIKRLSEPAPKSSQKIEPVVKPEVIVSTSVDSDVCHKKQENTKPDVLHDSDSFKLQQKATVDAAGVDAVPSITTDSVATEVKQVSTDIPDSKPREEKAAVAVPTPKDAGEVVHIKSETVVVVAGTSAPSVPLEAEVSAAAQVDLAPVSLPHDDLQTTSLEGTDIEVDKSGKSALSADDTPGFVEARTEPVERELASLEATSSDVTVGKETEVPVNESVDEIPVSALSQENSEVISTEVSHSGAPDKEAVDSSLDEKSKSLLDSGELLLPEQSLITVVPDLSSDVSGENPSGAQSAIQLEQKDEDHLKILNGNLPQTEDMSSVVIPESQPLTGHASSPDGQAHVETLHHPEETSEHLKHLQADAEHVKMGDDLKIDQIGEGKGKVSQDLIDSCNELSDKSSSVEISHEVVDTDLKKTDDHFDESHSSHDPGHSVPTSTDELVDELNKEDGNVAETVDSKENQDQTHAMPHLLEPEKEESSGISCDAAFGDKNLLSSDDKVSNEGEITHKVTEPITDEVAISVQSEASLLPDVTEPRQESSLELGDNIHETHGAESNINTCDSSITNVMKDDVDNSLHKEQIEFQDDVVESPSIDSQNLQLESTQKEAKTETGHGLEEIPSTDNESSEKRSEAPSEKESDDKTLVSNDESTDSAIKESECSDAEATESLRVEPGDNNGSNKEVIEDQ